ncbi:MAG: alpha/beta fold hydrolase [Deltaproteobacteria bacterium]|nr:MAG: alpha/beta fold hydrolase [Deltaproteobacteria bacterium]
MAEKRRKKGWFAFFSFLLGALWLFLARPPIFGGSFWAGIWLCFGVPALFGGWYAWRLLRGGGIGGKGIGLLLGGGSALLLLLLAILHYQSARLDIQIGFLETPEVHAQPEGRKIRLAYLEMKQTRGNGGTPILFLEDGPGGSGIVAALTDRSGLFTRLRKVGDVIALDQRGTSILNAPSLYCPETWRYPLEEPFSVQRALEILGPYLERCVEGFRERGVTLSAYNTAESVEDLEALRRELGAERVILWGAGYGAHLGLAYLRKYGDHVARAIFHGVEGPDHTWKLPETFDRALARLAERAARDPKVHREIPDLDASVRQIAEKLADRPISVSLTQGEERKTVRVGREDFLMWTALQLDEATTSMALPKHLFAFSQGNFESLARWTAKRIRSPHRSNLTAILTDCASGATAERKEKIRGSEETFFPTEIVNFPFPAVCDFVPYRDLGDEFRTPFSSRVPVLFISGSFDPRTPPENAEELLPHFPNGIHLLLEGAGHGRELFRKSPRFAEILIDFLEGKPIPTRKLAIARTFEPVGEGEETPAAMP